MVDPINVKVSGRSPVGHNNKLCPPFRTPTYFTCVENFLMFFKGHLASKTIYLFNNFWSVNVMNKICIEEL